MLREIRDKRRYQNEINLHGKAHERGKTELASWEGRGQRTACLYNVKSPHPHPTNINMCHLFY